MARTIFAWVLIVLSSIFLLAGVIGIGAAWYYNEPLTQRVVEQLNLVDDELAQAESTLEFSRAELARALRLVDAAQAALEKLAAQSTSAETLLEGIQNSLDDRLLPELKTARTRIDAARVSLEELRGILQTLSTLPFINLQGPDKIVADLIASAGSLDAEIANAEEIARRASTFVSDTSYLLGGDLTETRDSLQNFLAAVETYQVKVAEWRAQLAEVNASVPTWIDRASISLTIFLLWFALSQFGLLLHGLSLRRGDDPLEVLRS
jgi:DNA repair exonuclease SbcCD ATPase subunit